ncbi:MAG: ribbon-helix-helix protein, CopG family [bacterium]|nr:ribbon-helix-helix protein, CopG family [bacterium]
MLDDDVVRMIQEAANRERRSTSEVVNDALRRALQTEAATPYVVNVHHSDLRAGIDASRLNQLADEEADHQMANRLS